MLRWLDGRPLLDHIEGYRRQIFTLALDTFEPDGRPPYNLILEIFLPDAPARTD